MEWNAITTGNFGGFDAWITPGDNAKLDLTCNHGALQVNLNSLGIDDELLNVGGLKRQIRVNRLPEQLEKRRVEVRVPVSLHAGQDNPLWVCVTTEDGFQAWSSPIFLFK